MQNSLSCSDVHHSSFDIRFSSFPVRCSMFIIRYSIFAFPHSISKERKMTRKVVSSPNAPAAIGPYSQAIIAGGFVFISGQIPIVAESGKIEADDIGGQTRQVMANLKSVLTAAGTDFSKVVKTSIYLVDLGHFGTVNEIYGSYFPKDPPARACVQVSKLPKDSLVEIEMVALA